jgi:hypothetical protein
MIPTLTSGMILANWFAILTKLMNIADDCINLTGLGIQHPLSFSISGMSHLK